MCNTPEQLNAWAINLGHESAAIMLKHYGKMDSARKSVVLSSLDTDDVIDTEDASLLLDFICHDVTRGTPKYERVQRMKERHLMKMGA